MEDEKNKLWYFVDDINTGVLISTALKDRQAKKIFPEMPTLTFICKDSYDAIHIAKLMLDKQEGAPYELCDTVIEVNQVFFSDKRFEEDLKFKIM